jgi:hypothetical protein
MPIVGSFAGASARAYGLGAGLAAPIGYNSIATTTVGSGGSSTITFSSIPQTYKHLQIRALARNTVANTDDNIHIRFNSDTGNNYSCHFFYGNQTSKAAGVAGSSDLMIGFRVPGASSSANMFGVGVVDILDYNNSNKYKTIRSITGHNQNGSGSVWLFSGNWRNTSAITSISIFYGANNIAQYSSFALYGLAA